MSTFATATVEPRPKFTSYLIDYMREVAHILYREDNCFEALQDMRGLIDILDPQSKEECLIEQRQQIETYLATRYSKQQVHQLFSSITSYLHRSYLQEVSMGLIPTATLKGEDEIPSHEKVPTRLTAKLE